jgi:hypothetical protein
VKTPPVSTLAPRIAAVIRTRCLEATGTAPAIFEASPADGPAMLREP